METKVVCRAIILDDKNRVLLGKRVRAGGEGQWALVGGTPDGGESLEETVVREVKEELAIDFLSPQLFKKFVDQADVESHRWEVYVYFGSFKGQPVIKEDEVADVIFLGKDELDQHEIAFNHKEILQGFFSSQKL